MPHVPRDIEASVGAQDAAGPEDEPGDELTGKFKKESKLVPFQWLGENEHAICEKMRGALRNISQVCPLTCIVSVVCVCTALSSQEPEILCSIWRMLYPQAGERLCSLSHKHKHI